MFCTSLDSPIFSLSVDVMFGWVTIESNRGSLSIFTLRLGRIRRMVFW